MDSQQPQSNPTIRNTIKVNSKYLKCTNSVAPIDTFLGGHNFYIYLGNIFLHRHVKSPVSAPPIKVNWGTKIYWGWMTAYTSSPNWRHWNNSVGQLNKNITRVSKQKLNNSRNLQQTRIISRVVRKTKQKWFQWSTRQNKTGVRNTQK